MQVSVGPLKDTFMTEYEQKSLGWMGWIWGVLLAIFIVVAFAADAINRNAKDLNQRLENFGVKLEVKK
jgi:hypothetical protein